MATGSQKIEDRPYPIPTGPSTQIYGTSNQNRNYRFHRGPTYPLSGTLDHLGIVIGIGDRPSESRAQCSTRCACWCFVLSD